MSTVPNAIGISVQYEHRHTIICKPIFVGMGLCLYRRERIGFSFRGHKNLQHVIDPTFKLR